jgi:protein-S-isoprenylcysteine O-methyltransferase Ste14
MAPETAGSQATKASWTLLSAVFPASRKAILINYSSAAALLVLGYVFYTTHPFYRGYFAGVTFEVLGVLLITYLLALPFYYATFPDSYTVKCRLFWRAVRHLGERPLVPEEKVALRAVLVKAFFLPLMLNWFLFQILGVQEHAQAFWSTGRFFPEGYWFFYTLIFMIDVVLFTIGYAVEHPWLGNEIKSVEPTLFGWLVTLACYPPLSITTRQVLGWPSDDYPYFDSALAQGAAGLAMLTLAGIYSWASVALCFKASNLTNRGIVKSGPYAYVRHPAYISKNLLWWVGSIPWFLACDPAQPAVILYGILGLLAWNGVYTLRAITEERHLSQDPAYAEYCARVKWRFVPGVF